MKTEGVSEQDPEREQAVQVVAKKFKGYLERMLATPAETPIEEQVASITSMIEERARDFIEPNDFTSLQQQIQQASFKNTAEVEAKLPSLVARFLLTHHSLKSLEEIMRSTQIDEKGWIGVNEVLSYEVGDNDIKLHVPTVLTKKPLEMLKLWEAGLKTIAKQLNTEPSFKEIHRVVGYSWIVFEYPQFLERMGFTVSERSTEEREALASISREAFLKRYGN